LRAGCAAYHEAMVVVLPLIAIGILIGCFIRYVLGRPGERPPEPPPDGEKKDDDVWRWNAGWF
jgi:hypothetical protein